MVECAVRASGLEEYNAKMREIKEEGKKKILEFLEKEGKITNRNKHCLLHYELGGFLTQFL